MTLRDLSVGALAGAAAGAAAAVTATAIGLVLLEAVARAAQRDAWRAFGDTMRAQREVDEALGIR